MKALMSSVEVKTALTFLVLPVFPVEVPKLFKILPPNTTKLMEIPRDRAEMKAA
jgi:hypothetical protein